MLIPVTLVVGCAKKGDSSSYDVNSVLQNNEEFADYYNIIKDIKSRFNDEDTTTQANSTNNSNSVQLFDSGREKVSGVIEIKNCGTQSNVSRDTMISDMTTIKAYLSQPATQQLSNDSVNILESFNAVMAIAFDMPVYLGQIITKDQNATTFYGKTLAIGLNSEMMDETYYRAEKNGLLRDTYAYEPSSNTLFYSTVKYSDSTSFDFIFIQKELNSNDVNIAYADADKNYINVRYSTDNTSIVYTVNSNFATAFEMFEGISNDALSTFANFANYIDETKTTGLKGTGTNNGADYVITDEQYNTMIQQINSELNSKKSNWFIVNGTLQSYTATGEEGSTLEIPEGIKAIDKEFTVYVVDGKGKDITTLKLPASLTSVKEQTTGANRKYVTCNNYEFCPRIQISYDNNSLKSQDTIYTKQGSPYYRYFQAFEVAYNPNGLFFYDSENCTLVTCKNNIVTYICDNANLVNLDLSDYKFISMHLGGSYARLYLDKIKTIKLVLGKEGNSQFEGYIHLLLPFLLDNIVNVPFDIEKVTIDLTAYNDKQQLTLSSRCPARGEDSYMLQSHIREIEYISNVRYLEDTTSFPGQYDTTQLLAGYTYEELVTMKANNTLPDGCDKSMVDELIWYRKYGHSYDTVIDKITITGTAIYLNDILTECDFEAATNLAHVDEAYVYNNFLETINIRNSENSGVILMARQKSLVVHAYVRTQELGVIIAPDATNIVIDERYSSSNPFVTIYIHYATTSEDDYSALGITINDTDTEYYNEDTGVKLILVQD